MTQFNDSKNSFLQLVGEFQCRAGKNIPNCVLVSSKLYAVKMYISLNKRGFLYYYHCRYLLDVISLPWFQFFILCVYEIVLKIL